MSVETIRMALGRLQDDPENDSAWNELDGQRPDVDVVRLRLASLEEVRNPEFVALLREHVDAVQKKAGG